MANQELNKALEILGGDIVVNMRRALINQGSGPGRLESSIESDVVERENNVPALQISMNDYGIVLDEGRGPSRKKGVGGNINGFFANLKAWVANRLNIRGEQELNQVTYLIYRKINERGYKPKPFIQKSLEEAVNKNENNIIDAGFQVLVNDVDATLSKAFGKSYKIK